MRAKRTVSQICALMVFPSIGSDRVANSTPMVGFRELWKLLAVALGSTGSSLCFVK